MTTLVIHLEHTKLLLLLPLDIAKTTLILAFSEFPVQQGNLSPDSGDLE